MPNSSGSDTGSAKTGSSVAEPILVPCCADPLPETLHFELSESGGSPLDGLSGELTWRPETGQWQWDGEECEWPVRIVVLCEAVGEDVFSWGWLIGWLDDFATPTQICLPFDQGSTFLTQECDPLELSGPYIADVSGPCPCDAPLHYEFTLTVTE